MRVPDLASAKTAMPAFFLDIFLLLAAAGQAKGSLAAHLRQKAYLPGSTY
jgi:hypothetical protein